MSDNPFIFRHKGGDLSPHTLVADRPQRIPPLLLRSHNLELTALGCPLHWGLDSPEDQQQCIDLTKAVQCDEISWEWKRV
jgi:hypothetical protein